MTIQEFIERGKIKTPDNPEAIGGYFGDKLDQSALIVWDKYMAICKIICLLLLLSGVLGMILGWKKGKQLGSIALLVYIISLIVNSVIKS